MATTKRHTRKSDIPAKSRTIGIRLTDAMYAAVEKTSAHLGLDPATYGRMCILRDTDYDPSREHDGPSGEKKSR